MHATRNPDGSFSLEGQRYRLKEKPDAEGTYDVCEETTGTLVGSFRMHTARDGEPQLEVLPPSEAAETVRAIAALLEMPRGALPLQ
jgi:hypothetical protein